MMKFDFMVQTSESVVTVVNRSVALPNLSAAWPLVTALAHSVNKPGSVILVSNEVGQVMIRIGIACARSLANIHPELAA